MLGKTVVISGATSGIDEAAAMDLAHRGARIVFTARDRKRADATMAKLNAISPNSAHAVHMADLSNLADMKRVGAELAREYQIDVLINNAGAIFGSRRETIDGLEMTFALNHMAYFVITNTLLPKLKTGARIVTVASNGHRRVTLDFEDLQSRHGYSGHLVYCRSKLANMLFSHELVRQVPFGVTANSLYPGFVATRIETNNLGILGKAKCSAKRIATALGVKKPTGAISPAEGAKTLVYLASSPEVSGVTGHYFHNCAITEPSLAAQDDADAKRLWEISAKLAWGA